MLLDAEQRQDDWFRDVVFDVCICGAGPAGITLARQLAAKGWNVGLFESGDLDLKLDAQELAEGKNIGLDYFSLDSVRLRVLGGTSGHWTGVTHPFEEHDFEPHPHHPLSGWPITRSDLEPYAEETAKILDLGPQERVADMFQGASGELKPISFRSSRPITRFGEKYRAKLASSNIRTYLNATLVDIELDAHHGFVSQLIFRSYNTEAPFSVRARYVVLCFGGIENARFLLNANRQVSAGIGNQHDLVGRYFSEHPVFQIGSAVLQRVSRDGPYSHYIPSRQMMLKEKCLNFVLSVSGLHEGRLMRLGREAVCLTEFSQQLVKRALGRTIQCFDIGVWVGFEQALNRDSRVRLSDKVDRFGQRRAVLDWRFIDLDYHTMRTAIIQFGRQLAATNLGRARISDWLQAARPQPPGIDKDVVGSIHHMCTTRMSENPREGVVDRNCRVHGIQNLYIGGSSVFATGSYAHPTYTIVQLALRLADHLDGKLRS
jgi:choline dehydrogenase-like flavoprotein